MCAVLNNNKHTEFLLRRVKDWPFHDGICETLFLDELGDYKIITSF